LRIGLFSSVKLEGFLEIGWSPEIARPLPRFFALLGREGRRVDVLAQPEPALGLFAEVGDSIVSMVAAGESDLICLDNQHEGTSFARWYFLGLSSESSMR
jgi:hypothetical protein